MQTITELETVNFLENFKAGVISAHKKYDIDLEYASLFWGNVYGDEFDSAIDAYTNGVESVEYTITDFED